MNPQLIIHEHEDGNISFYFDGELIGVLQGLRPEQLAPAFLAVYEAGHKRGRDEN